MVMVMVSIVSFHPVFGCVSFAISKSRGGFDGRSIAGGGMVKVGDDNRGGGEEREVVGTEGSRGETRGMKVVVVVVRTPARGFGGGSSGGSAIVVVVGVRR